MKVICKMCYEQYQEGVRKEVGYKLRLGNNSIWAYFPELKHEKDEEINYEICMRHGLKSLQVYDALGEEVRTQIRKA